MRLAGINPSARSCDGHGEGVEVPVCATRSPWLEDTAQVPQAPWWVGHGWPCAPQTPGRGYFRRCRARRANVGGTPLNGSGGSW